jgi:hypothetical protein
MQRNYVIGAGISGLIVGYILGWPVIGKDIGGQMSSPFPLGPRILEECGETVWLISKLGVKLPPAREYKIGYMNQGGFIYDCPEQGFAEAYYAKTRLYDPRDLIWLPNSTMSGGKKYIKGWDLDSIGLVDILAERVDRVPFDVGMIFLGRHSLSLSNGSEMLYDRLISTIPLPTLDQLVGSPLKMSGHTFRSFDTIFVQMTVNDPSPVMGMFDYVYVANENIPYHRITRLQDTTYVYEFRSDRYPGIFKSRHDTDVIPRRKFIGKNYQIVNEKKLLRVLDIDLIGRYAQWDHDIKIEDVIGRAIEYGKQMGSQGE